MITNFIYRTLSLLPPLQRQFKRVVRRLPHRLRQVKHFGHLLWVDPTELHGFYLYYEQAYDDHIFEFLLPKLSRYQRVIDIGANIGIYTVFFAKHVPTVDAFEPEPQVLQRLHKNLALNSLHNVSVHEVCLADRSGEIGFIAPDQHNQGIGQVILNVPSSQVFQTRKCITLTDFLQESAIERCLIKIDIEGAELLALRGGRKALAQKHKYFDILLEIHPEDIGKLGGTVEELRDLLVETGFHVYGLTSNGLEELPSDISNRFWWATTEISEHYICVS